MSRGRSWLAGNHAWAWFALISAGVIFLRGYRWDQMPPGLHFDEAVFGLLAREISLTHLPVYFSAYAGREPLYMYLLALLFQFMGPTLLAIRLLPLVISLATLATTFWMIRDLYGERVAILTTALWGTSLWAQAAGRYSHANLLMPPLEAMAFLALWRGYHKGQLGWFLAGGVITGLGLYTYAAARFFPLAVLVVFLGLAIVDRERWKKTLPLILAGAALATLVAAPLTAHFLSHPADFWERPGQVFLFSTLPPEKWAAQIVENSEQTIAGFFIEGDSNWRVNLPPRPVFDALIGGAFLSGLVLALWRWRRPEYLLAVFWLAVMSLPAILTQGPHPNTQRLIGTWPILFVFPALGLSWLGEKALGRFSLIAPRLLPLLVALLVVGEGANTFRLYFGEWASSPQVYRWYDVAYKEMMPLLQEEMQSGREVVIGSLHYRHPTLAFLLPRSNRAIWMLGGRTVVFPQTERNEIAYVLGLPDNPQKPEVTSYLASLASAVETYPDPGGDPAIMVYHVPRARLPEPQSGGLSLNGEVLIQKVAIPSSARRDEALPVFISWSVLNPPSTARSMVLHLVDERGVRWSQASEPGFIWDQWQNGDFIYQWLELPVERTMPPGLYEVRLFLTDAAANPLPVLDRDGKPQGIFLSLGKVEITPQGGRVEAVSPSGISFGDALQVIEFDLLPGTVSPGGQLQFSVTWQAMQALPDLEISVELRDAGANPWAQYSFPLAYGYSTSQWQVGEVVRTVYVIDLGAEVVPGETQIVLRVPRLSGEIDLGTIEVLGGERIFEVPPIQHRLVATLGTGEIAFLGYDLAGQEFRPGDEIMLRLYWQSRMTVAESYKVFVHLLDLSGQVVLQDDSLPAGWSRPTTGWAEGEIVIDEHRLNIPATFPSGEYLIVVGMYEEITLRRLPVYDAMGNPQPEDRLHLESIMVVGQ